MTGCNWTETGRWLVADRSSIKNVYKCCLSESKNLSSSAVGSSSGSGMAALCTTAVVSSLASAGSAVSLIFLPALQTVVKLKWYKPSMCSLWILLTKWYWNAQTGRWCTANDLPRLGNHSATNRRWPVASEALHNQLPIGRNRVAKSSQLPTLV